VVGNPLEGEPLGNAELLHAAGVGDEQMGSMSRGGTTSGSGWRALPSSPTRAADRLHEPSNPDSIPESTPVQWADDRTGVFGASSSWSGNVWTKNSWSSSMFARSSWSTSGWD
jgi:hypothetical protein